MMEAYFAFVEQYPQQVVLLYWLIAAVLGGIFLRDWIMAWNVPATLQRGWLVVFLVVSWLVGQVIYVLVTDDGGRAFHLPATVIFALGNGVFETFAFALVYRLGEVIGQKSVGRFAPRAGSIAGFVLGLLLLVAYNGAIHALFWMYILPEHFAQSAMADALRVFHIPALAVMLVGWTLCWWLEQDLWTVVLFHVLVDVVLMVQVHPPLW
jgi:hypothetical protein